jgi:hypothetical protein
MARFPARKPGESQGAFQERFAQESAENARLHELRVVDGEGRPVELTPGKPVALRVNGESFEGTVADSDQGGVAHLDFNAETYAALHKARASKRSGRMDHSEDIEG